MLEKKYAVYPTAERAVDGIYALIDRMRLLSNNQRKLVNE
jgi:hypothetical protein